MGFARGDIRVDRRGEWMIERIAATGSLVLRQIGGTRTGEQAARRFLDSPSVSTQSIMAEAASRTARQCAGAHIVAVQDTTEINFAGASAKRKGFGPGGNGRDPGFFIHPVIAVDADAEAVIGAVSADIWTRPRADKESERWISTSKQAADALADAASVTIVADRESDLYPMFAKKPDRAELIVRAAQDRVLADGGHLFEALAKNDALAVTEIVIPPRGPGQKARKTKLALKAGRVCIVRPKHRRGENLPETIELSFVEAREIDPPDPNAAICWRLLTTRCVETAEEAADIIRLYRLRWRIEQVFRTLKSDGLGLDASQITEPKRLFHLSALALIAAVRIIQLVDARDGSTRPATDVIDEDLIEPVARISKSLEGGTERQKNPHAKGSLAWISWVAARLGGWNCYYKPPGPKTMRDGWTRLAERLAGYVLARAEADP